TPTKKALATNTAVTLTVPQNHVFSGDQITVNTGDSRFDGTFTATGGGQAAGGANATVTYTLPAAITASLTNKSASGGTVTLSTSTAPPLEAGDTVSVAAGAAAYNGSFAVTAVNAGAKTFSYSLGSTTFNTSAWSRSGTTVTITTAAHGLNAGDT